MEESQGPAVGIDLGTTRSVIAYLDTDGRPCTIRNAEGDATTPSAVFFDPDGPIVGKEAENAARYEPERVAEFAKREMGEFRFEKTICGRRFPPEVIQALVLRKLKQDAELVLGQVRDAVITVPAYFNEPRRKATQDAGVLAGLNVLDIINEPTAAAVAYGVHQKFLATGERAVSNERILVYDLGGGTFDVTLMDIDGGDFTTVATAGDVYLGGIDWDQRIVDHVAGLFADQFGVNPLDDESARQHLRVQAEAAKMALTARRAYNLHFEFVGNRLKANLTREIFESLTRDLVERTLFTVRRLLKDAAVGWSDLTRVLVVGGSTRMPMITDALQAESGMTLDRSVSPDEAVAHGAAVYASVLRSDDKLVHGGICITNVNSHDLGVLAVEARTGRPRRKVLIPRNTPLPADGSGQFKTRDEGQRSVVVNVIEGGDASGTNATPIGRCVIADLPPGLPAKSSVDVRFTYKENGRLHVEAWLPEAKRQASLTVERAAGLSDNERAEWAERLAAGLRLEVEDENANLPDIEPFVSTVNVGAPGNFTVPQQPEISGIYADDETQTDGVGAPAAGEAAAEVWPGGVEAAPADEDPDLDDFLKGFESR